MPENLDILNLQAALKVVSGNKQLADDLLAMFIKEIPNYIQSVQTLLQEGDKEELKAVVHKIHGGLRYLGAPALMAVVSQTDAGLFDLSDAELNEDINRMVFEMERIKETGSYPE